MPREIKDYVWTPNKNFGRQSHDINRCRYSVAEGGRSVGFNQCTRKPVEKIQGYGFCKQHGEIVKNALGLIVGDKILYFARFSKYNKAYIVKLFILRETPQKYVLTKSENILEKSYLGNTIRKDGTGQDMGYGDTAGKFFDNEADAYEYIAQCIEKKKINLQKEIEKLDGQQEEMSEEFYHKYGRHMNIKGNQ